MSYDKNRNYTSSPITITKEAIEVYKRWREQKRVASGIHHISEALIELLERDMYEMKLKTNYAVSVHPQAQGQVNLKQAECLDIINKRWHLNKIEEETLDKIIISLHDIHSIIERVFGFSNERTINREKKKLFNILKLKQIRKGNEWFVVSEYYEDTDKKLEEYIKTKEAIDKKVNLILEVIKDKKGLTPEELLSYIGDNQEVKLRLNKSKQIKFDEIRNKFIPLTNFELAMVGGVAK